MEEAAKIGTQTTTYVATMFKSRRYLQHAYRSCLGILSLTRKYPHPQIETACQILLPAGLLSYRDVHAELEWNAANQPAPSLPAHENVRGNTYYH